MSFRRLIPQGPHSRRPGGDSPAAPPTHAELRDAIRSDDADALSALIERGAKVNGAEDLRPLVAAAQNGCAQAIAALLAAGADPLLPQRGFTPLMAAALSGQEACFDLLLPVSNPQQRDPLIGYTALFYAAVSPQPGALAILRRLAKKDALLNLDALGRNALMAAANASSCLAVSALCKRLDLSAQCHKGRNALAHAILSEETQSLALASDCLAKISTTEIVNAPDEDGFTPLMHAAESRNAAHLRAKGLFPALIERADFSLSAPTGETLFSLLLDWALDSDDEPEADAIWATIESVVDRVSDAEVAAAAEKGLAPELAPKLFARSESLQLRAEFDPPPRQAIPSSVSGEMRSLFEAMDANSALGETPTPPKSARPPRRI